MCVEKFKYEKSKSTNEQKKKKEKNWGEHRNKAQNCCVISVETIVHENLGISFIPPFKNRAYCSTANQVS